MPYWFTNPTTRPLKITFILFFSPLLIAVHVYSFFFLLLLVITGVRFKLLCSSFIRDCKQLKCSTPIYANSCLSPEYAKSEMHFISQIVSVSWVKCKLRQMKSTKVQYYDTLKTLQHSWRMSLWFEWELEVQRLIIVVKCMHFYIKVHCSIFVNIFHNKSCKYGQVAIIKSFSLWFWSRLWVKFFFYL